jgi:hypothetical protein
MAYNNNNLGFVNVHRKFYGITNMLDSLLIILKWLPAVTLFYLLFSALTGLDVNKILLAIAIFLDLLTYLPIGD